MKDLYSIQLLSEEHRQFLLLLNERLEEKKMSYGESEKGWYHGTLPCQYNYRNKVRILQNNECGIMPHMVLDFRNSIDRGSLLIESIPEEYRVNIPQCKGCKKGCTTRTIIPVEDKKYALCHGQWWRLPVLNGTIDFIVNGLRL